MAKFINPFTDVGFKRIFGQEFSKPLLLDFLNSLLEGEKHIVNLTFLDKEQPALYDEDRSLIYDIYCETDEGEHIIVEMQNKSQPYFKSRSIYYISESIARQGERGSSWNYAIDSVYLIAFLNFIPLDFKQQFRTDVVLAEKNTVDQFSDKLRMIYLQLPLFKKEADECENQVERWIYLLKNMETLSRLPWAAQSAVFKKLESIADVGAMSRDERLKYDEALRKYRDTISVFEGVRMDGLMEGRMEGRKEGRKEGRMEGLMEGQRSEKMENARKMKIYGLALDMIAEITGLSIEEVRGL
ncbi:MAG: Rpn family recombination-promoting nuclease/putative transposase [Prevotella sp.]|nr:Rpn family recombination-promoting nuclease/putative transposase [Prevotella sp.]MDY5657285.1 Rpn family recombination-promoting nuclease/putative transposase [Prevotella sp.]